MAKTSRQNQRNHLSNGRNDEKTRQTYYIRQELIEKVRAYAYWERLGVSKVVNMALEDFFSDKKVMAIPDR